MAGRLILDACNPALDANGAVDIGASLQFYENRTTTPQAVYEGPSLDVALDNPLEPDSAGRFPEIWGPDGSTYTVEWTPTGESPITFNDITLTGDTPAVSEYFFLFKYAPGVLTNSQTLLRANLPVACALAADLNDGVIPSIFTVETNPTATTTLTLKQNNSSIGSIAFSTSGVPTVTFAAQVSFAASDQFSVHDQASADATAAGFSLTFAFRAL